MLASKEPEYVVLVRAFLYKGRSCRARWEVTNTTATIQKVLRWRFFPPSAGLDLDRQTDRPCTFARNEDDLRRWTARLR
ncbi:MAG: hypothetical protein Q4A61_05760 [Porphyromonadaceae bacterium]|nr:hypothetical protein [Porphyromonadaceae bacterium]